MINPTNVVKNTSTTAAAITNRKCEITEMLCGVLESITNSHSHSLEVETTLDHELIEGEVISDEEDEKTLCKEFSLDYMPKAVSFYDEINPQTGKRKERWEIVKHRFRRIPHQNYLARFRHSLEKHSTKKTQARQN